MSQRIQRLGIVSIVGLFLACGGGSDAVSPPTPPPPPPPPPASLGPPAQIVAVQGNGQIGEPGTVLAVRPAAIVRDSLGRALSGVSVSFSIDSGAGVVLGGQTTTGADGVATAGTWTLGVIEGRNTIRATAGALPPIKFEATAVVATVTVGTGQSTPNGGTVVIDRPGSALDRFTITIPDSAFSSTVSFTVRQSSSAGMDLPEPGAPGAATLRTSARSAFTAAATNPAVTPVITIVTNGPASANGALLLRIPVPLSVANPIVAVVDSIGTRLAYLPILSRDTASVTVSTRILAPALFQQIGNIPQPTSPPPHALSLVVFKGPTGLPSLSQYAPWPISVSYVYGKDNFAFRSIPTIYTARIDPGIILLEYASGFYFPGGVFHAFDRATNVTYSDTRGIMTSAGVTRDAGLSMGRYGAQWIAAYKNQSARYDYEMATAVINMLAYSRRPVPLWLSDGTYLYMVLVIGWDPTTTRFTIRDPNYPTPLSLSFAGGVMAPYPDPWTASVRYTMPYFTYDWLAAYWPRMAAYLGTMVSASAPELFSTEFRNAQVQSRGAVALRATPDTPDSLFFLADTTRIWPITQTPPYAQPTTLPVTPGWGLGIANLYNRTPSGVWSTTRDAVGTSFLYDWTSFPNGKAETVGVEILEPQFAGDQDPAWAGWRELRLIKYGLSVTKQFASPGTPSTFSPVLAPGSPSFPSGVKFEWDFGDNTPKHVASSLTAVNHTYTTGGDYTVVLRVLHTARNDLPIARVSTTGAVSAGSWLITSITDADALYDEDLEGSGTLDDLLQRLLSTPTSGIISIDPDGNGNALKLRVLSTFVWNPFECCPPVPRGNEISMTLGPSVAQQHAFGPYFAAWQTSSFTRTATTMQARQAISPFRTYQIRNGGAQTGPSGGWLFNAVMNGNTLTGTITLAVFWIDEETGEIDSPEEHYRFPFTATRMGS